MLIRVFSLAFIFFGVSADEPKEAVVTLTDETFDSHVKAHPKTLVKFYAPWCGHCKKIAPEFEKAAAQLKSKGVSLAKVDATVETELGKKYAIKGYPTLLWFIDGGEPQEFDGGRDADGIVDWVNMMTGPAVKVVETVEAPLTKPVVALYGPEITPAFEQLAKTTRKDANFVFVKSSSKKKLTITHKGEPAVETTDSKVMSDVTKLKDFWSSHSFPVFGQLDGESYSKYMAREGFGLVWLLYPMASSDELKAVEEKNRPTATALAKAFPKLSFTYTDTVQFKGAIENMLGVKEYPAMVVYKKATDKSKYVYEEGDMSEKALKSWLNDVLSGKVPPKLKSEEAPLVNDEPVRVAVGTTLEKELFFSDKDILLEVYAPWCGHCKKLEPEYNKVAKKIRKEGLEDMIRLVKMDGAANDSPLDSISWDGFPSLFYIRAGSKTPEKFEGGRDAKSIWKWIKKNHTHHEKLTEKIKDKKSAEKEEL